MTVKVVILKVMYGYVLIFEGKVKTSDAVFPASVCVQRRIEGEKMRFSSEGRKER